MKDLANLFDEVLGDLKGAEFPTFPTSNDTCGNSQDFDIASGSHTSHISHTENQPNEIGSDLAQNNREFFGSGARARAMYEKSVGNVGSVGNGEKTLAGSTSYLFPQRIEEVGNVGKDDPRPEPPILDLNRASPQRSDWWTGPLMADLDRTALPIPPEKVRAGVERELRALADLGREDPDALRDAIAITAAKIRNSEALVERQVHDGRCHVCGHPLDDTLPVISVLTGRPGAHLHLHLGCHAEHVRRRAALVDKIMAAAGYGGAAS